MKLLVFTNTVNCQPYGGLPWMVPGLIEAEDYDTGGQGVAYNDTTAGNLQRQLCDKCHGTGG